MTSAIVVTMETPMIEIRCTSGDVAHAEDAEAALLAGRTLIEDAEGANRVWGYEATVTFLAPNGAVLRAGVSRYEIIAGLVSINA